MGAFIRETCYKVSHGKGNFFRRWVHRSLLCCCWKLEELSSHNCLGGQWEQQTAACCAFLYGPEKPGGCSRLQDQALLCWALDAHAASVTFSTDWIGRGKTMLHKTVGWKWKPSYSVSSLPASFPSKAPGRGCGHEPNSPGSWLCHLAARSPFLPVLFGIGDY